MNSFPNEKINIYVQNIEFNNLYFCGTSNLNLYLSLQILINEYRLLHIDPPCNKKVDIKYLVRMTRFWNNLPQRRSKWKDWKDK